MSFSLAVDVGATFIKVARTDGAGEPVGPVTRVVCPQGAPTAGPGSSVIDPWLLAQTVSHAIAETTAGETPSRIAIANQMHGFVVVDDDCHPLTGIATWQDSRGVGAIDAIRQRAGADVMLRVGNELRSGIPLATLTAIHSQGESVGKGKVLSLGDWVVASLTGSLPIMHTTNAAAMGMYSLVDGQWNQSCLAIAGLTDDRLPDISDTVCVVGTTTEGSEVLVAVGDQQAALYGMGLRDNELSFNVATGAQVSRIAVSGLAANVQTRPFFGGKLLHTVTHIPAGRALNAWVLLLAEIAEPNLTLDEAWERVFARLSVEPPAAKPTFALGIFDSADGNRGSVTDITEQNLTVDAFVGGAIRSCAASLARHAERVGYDGIEQAVFSGGWLKSGRLMDDYLVAALPVPVRVADDGEDVLRGLARLNAAA